MATILVVAVGVSFLAGYSLHQPPTKGPISFLSKNNTSVENQSTKGLNGSGPVNGSSESSSKSSSHDINGGGDSESVYDLIKSGKPPKVNNPHYPNGIPPGGHYEYFDGRWLYVWQDRDAPACYPVT